MNGWREVAFSEAVDINPWRHLKKGTVVPYVEMASVAKFQRRVVSIVPRQFRGSGSRFRNGDTLFARITPCLENGKTAFISELTEQQVGWGSTEFIVMSGRPGITHNLFVYYLAISPEVRRHAIQSMMGTSGRQRVEAAAFDKLIVSLPPLPIQRRIAEILGRLDDKIEVNRRINRTLEAMAQALYRHWFVDFGPFQDGEFVESALGLIPRGWEVGKLRDVVDLLSGGTPKTSKDEYWGGEIQWVAAKDVAAGAPFIMTTERTVTRLGVKNSATKILPPFTTVITARGTVGELGLMPNEMAMNQTSYGVRGRGSLGHFSTYLILKNTVENLRKHAYGTVFDTITRMTFESVDVLISPAFVWQTFEDRIAPLFLEMLMTQRQSKELTITRDYVLPKLLSGELEINE